MPPAFAIAAALTFASTSPVSSVSGTWPLLLVVVEPVVVVAVAACFAVPAPNATVAPARAPAASATAPAHFFQALVIDVLPLGSGAPISGQHGSLREALEITENVLRVRSAASREGGRTDTGGHPRFPSSTRQLMLTNWKLLST